MVEILLSNLYASSTKLYDELKGSDKLNALHDKVIYQIYPMSYKDTTGNGYGDLKGIIENHPMLQIWAWI